MMVPCLLEEVQLDHAEDLLAQLSAHSGARWSDRSREDDFEWIYRGQSNAAWGLTPSALRQDAFADFTPAGAARPWPKNHLPERAYAETRLVRDFAKFVDEQGLEVPDDSQKFRRGPKHYFDPADPRHVVDFPKPKYRGMFALAQHFGVPTRLLDWSWNARVAAYFSCVDVAKKRTLDPGKAPERFAVWALSREFATRLERNDPFVTIVTVPRVSNPNLRAQMGLFTLVGFRSVPSVDELPDLDKICRDTPADSLACEAQLRRVPILYKYSVPSREARALLRLLAIEGVSGASIYPGHHGAVIAMRERQWFQPAPRGERS